MKVDEIGLNPHVIGIVMKETVRRAMGVIREKRFLFEATAKAGHSGKMDDMVTSADKAAQQVYIKVLRECFPDFGILAEEEGLRIECKIDGVELFFTVDPLDGTKAFVRKQSHGIGTMISLVSNWQKANYDVAAAFVGDVMTQEIYGYRPYSGKVHRIYEFERAETLVVDEKLKLKNQYVLLRTDVHKHTSVIQKLVGPRKEGGAFKGSEITGGSIGTSMARLWKGEVGAAVLHSQYATPWDLAPVLGITDRMGFVFLRSLPTANFLVPYTPVLMKEIYKETGDTLIIHRSRLSELCDFFR